MGEGDNIIRPDIPQWRKVVEKTDLNEIGDVFVSERMVGVDAASLLVFQRTHGQALLAETEDADATPEYQKIYQEARSWTLAMAINVLGDSTPEDWRGDPSRYRAIYQAMADRMSQSGRDVPITPIVFPEGEQGEIKRAFRKYYILNLRTILECKDDILAREGGKRALETSINFSRVSPIQNLWDSIKDGNAQDQVMNKPKQYIAVVIALAGKLFPSTGEVRPDWVKTLIDLG